jgi:hypothetical protein
MDVVVGGTSVPTWQRHTTRPVRAKWRNEAGGLRGVRHHEVASRTNRQLTWVPVDHRQLDRVVSRLQPGVVPGRPVQHDVEPLCHAEERLVAPDHDPADVHPGAAAVGTREASSSATPRHAPWSRP